MDFCKFIQMCFAEYLFICWYYPFISWTRFPHYVLVLIGRIGFLVGFLFSSIMLSVVTAAIHTVIICLAESPSEFNANHPGLSNKLQSAWKIKKKKMKISVF